MIPCRIGQDEAIDNAVEAIVRNKDIALNEFDGPTPGCLGTYIKSVRTLRLAMENRNERLSDNVLVAAALLCVCEALMRSEMFACFAHWAAMSTILLSRPPSWQPSEVSRAILYHIRNQTFHIPVARGQISPFDDPRWYTLEPAGASTLPSELARLKLLGNQLMIRLPRLIIWTRSLRAQSDETTFEEAIALADELSRLQDLDAESKMRHRIKVISTTHPDDAAFIPFSFHFHSLADLETMVIYWKYHLILGKLRLKLRQLDPGYALEVEKLRRSMERMGVNVMMSHQYACDRQQYAHTRGVVAMSTGWTAVWGLWDDRDVFRGISREEWRRWCRERINESIAIWGFQSGEEMVDEASDLLVGGPLKGMFVAAFADIPAWATKIWKVE